MRCEDVRALLPASGEEPVDLRAQRHIETCLSCQAETSRYQKMLRALGELREVRMDVPSGLLDDTLAGIGGPSVVRVMSGKQKAALAGAVGAVAAGAAATAVVVLRKRGLRVPALAAVLAR